MKNYSNIGTLHKECADERLIEFQKDNPNLILSEGMFVKIKFSNDTDNEWMWVKIKSYDKETKEIKGTLGNDPIILKNIKFDDLVEFNYSEICDVYNT